MWMYHFYNQINPPSLEEIANARPIEKLWYFASMEIAMEDEQERLEAIGF